MGEGWGGGGGEQARRRWPRTVARAKVDGGGSGRQQGAPMWPMSSILMPVCSIFFPPVTSMSTWRAAHGLTVSGSTAALRQGGSGRTVPHTLSDALNRYCSTSFSFTLVVTVCRVSASANVTLNFAGAPVKKEVSDIRPAREQH